MPTVPEGGDQYPHLVPEGGRVSAEDGLRRAIDSIFADDPWDDEDPEAEQIPPFGIRWLTPKWPRAALARIGGHRVKARPAPRWVAWHELPAVEVEDDVLDLPDDRWLDDRPWADDLEEAVPAKEVRS